MLVECGDGGVVVECGDGGVVMAVMASQKFNPHWNKKIVIKNAASDD